MISPYLIHKERLTLNAKIRAFLFHDLTPFAGQKTYTGTNFLVPGGNGVRHYNIYLIENDVAQVYFSKELQILQLFLEAERCTSPKHLEILQKQIDYITRPIPVTRIEHDLNKTLGERSDYNTSSYAYTLDLVDKQSNAELYLNKHCIMNKASGDFEAETMFFEILRNIDPCFLAMEFHKHRCGWLNPIKPNYFIRMSPPLSRE